MKFIRTVLMILLFVAPISISAQSKTEKVEDKMKSKNGGSSSSSSDDSDGSLGGFLFELFFALMPDIFYIEKFTPQEFNMNYNAHPYATSEYNAVGLQNHNSNKSFSFQAELDGSQFPFTFVDNNYAASAKFNYDYWGLDLSYRLWDEKGSPKMMHQAHAAIERKMRFFPNAEAGVQLGYQRLTIGDSAFNGAIFGIDTDYYWFEPLSFQLNWHALLYENTTATTWQGAVRYHFGPYAAVMRYQNLDFSGINFRSVNLGLVYYF